MMTITQPCRLSISTVSETLPATWFAIKRSICIFSYSPTWKSAPGNDIIKGGWLTSHSLRSESHKRTAHGELVKNTVKNMRHCKEWERKRRVRGWRLGGWYSRESMVSINNIMVKEIFVLKPSLFSGFSPKSRWKTSFYFSFFLGVMTPLLPGTQLVPQKLT